MLEKAKEYVVTRTLEVILVALASVLLVGVLAIESYLVKYVQEFAPSTLIRIAAVSITFGLLSLAYAFYSFPKLDFDKKIGIYFCRKSGEPYCPSCYAKKKHSPLKEQKNGWACMVKECKFFAPNSEHKPPARRAQSRGIGSDSWVKRW